jgi:hypothetical protein
MILPGDDGCTYIHGKVSTRYGEVYQRYCSVLTSPDMATDLYTKFIIQKEVYATWKTRQTLRDQNFFLCACGVDLHTCSTSTGGLDMP